MSTRILDTLESSGLFPLRVSHVLVLDANATLSILKLHDFRLLRFNATMIYHDIPTLPYHSSITLDKPLYVCIYMYIIYLYRYI